jgi:hypothetical protein
MANAELQNTLIREIQSIQNPLLLKRLESYLTKMLSEDKLMLTDYEKRIVETGISQVNEWFFFR